MLENSLKRAKPDRRKEIEAELAVPPIPDALRYLWRIFGRLASRRQSNGFGPARIGWLEIDAFQRLTGTRLAPWEIELIEQLDDLALAEPKPAEDESDG